MAIDHACHALFWAAADNKFLHDTLKISYGWSLRLWHYALPQVVNLRKAVLEHQEMLDALRRTRRDLAVRQMQPHIRSFQATIAGEGIGEGGDWRAKMRDGDAPRPVDRQSPVASRQSPIPTMNDEHGRYSDD